jgi:hypothetical protein
MDKHLSVKMYIHITQQKHSRGHASSAKGACYIVLSTCTSLQSLSRVIVPTLTYQWSVARMITLGRDGFTA